LGVTKRSLIEPAANWCQPNELGWLLRGVRMSALQTFEMIREYRQRAANYARMGNSAYSGDVRFRYSVIADHFTALTDAAMRADRAQRKKRLEEMQTKRALRKRAWEASSAIRRDLLRQALYGSTSSRKRSAFALLTNDSRRPGVGSWATKAAAA
jgi:4-alpha-glucanotransferase